MRPGLFVFLLLIASNVLAAKTPLIVGVWKAVDGKSIWLVRPDGTAYNSFRKNEGRWRLANKSGYDFIFSWQEGDGSPDHVKISRDKKTFEGFHPSKNTRWTQIRDSYPPPEKATKKKPAKPVKKPPTRQKKTKVRIPRHAVKYKGHYYMVFETTVPVTVAMSQCEKMGGHLARVSSPSEHRFVAQLIKNKSQEYYYVDGSDAAAEGVWKFSDGKPIRSIDWGPNDPNNWDNLEHWLIMSRDLGKLMDFHAGGRNLGFICEWDTANRGAKVKDVVEEREEPDFEEQEKEPPQPFSLDEEPQEEPLKPFSLDDDPVKEEADLPPPTDPEGILDRAGLYEGRRGVWYLNRANNFAARTYERLSKSSEIRSALRAVNGRLPTKAEMNTQPSRR